MAYSKITSTLAADNNCCINLDGFKLTCVMMNLMSKLLLPIRFWSTIWHRLCRWKGFEHFIRFEFLAQSHLFFQLFPTTPDVFVAF